MWQLLLASIIWAFSYSLNKQNLAGVNPFMVSFIFCASSVLLFLPTFRLRGLSLKKFLIVLALGALEFGLMYIFFQLSFAFLDAYEIALLLTTTPIYVVFADGIFNKAALALPCLLASLCVLLSFLLVSGAEYSFNRYGVLLIQGSNLSFAFGQVLVKKFFEKELLNKTTNFTKKAAATLSLTQCMSVLYLGGCCVCGLAAILTQTEYVPFTRSAMFWTIILGISCCGICHYLWDFGILRVKTPVAAVMNNLQIPLSMLIAVIFFGEHIDWCKLCICLIMLLFIAAIFLFYKHKNV